MLHSSFVAWKAVPAVPGLFLDADNDEILEDSLGFIRQLSLE